jgi:hypothetical protein
MRTPPASASPVPLLPAAATRPVRVHLEAPHIPGIPPQDTRMREKPVRPALLHGWPGIVHESVGGTSARTTVVRASSTPMATKQL